METDSLVTIIASGIAFITSFASLTYNLIQARKARVEKIILENRIRYLNEIRDGFSGLIGLCNPEAIQLAKKDSEVMKTYSKSLFLGYGKIKTYIKPFYDIDKELLTSLDSLYASVLSALNGTIANPEKIAKCREDFADKYLKYDWAYWKYIQTQISGKYVNSDDAFDEVYYAFTESLRNK